MILGSYKENLEGIKFEPYSFQGHGWLYSHNPKDEAQEKLLRAAGAFEIKGQKKNKGTILFRPRSGDPPPPRKKRACCGGR